MRELRNGLSRYLKHVRSGEMVVVTERGRPVARIIPAGIPEHLAKMAAEGRITLPSAPYRPPRKRIKLSPGPSLSDYISEDRG